jgi:hypothetical protein
MFGMVKGGFAQDCRISVVSQASGQQANERGAKAPEESTAAKIHAETFTLVSLGEGSAQYTTAINYSILHNGASGLSIALPGDTNIISVEGRGVLNWGVSRRGNQQHLDVSLARPVRDEYRLVLVYEKHIGSDSLSMELARIKVIGAEQQKGSIGIEARSNIEITARDIEGASFRDVSELPPTIWNYAQHPLLLGFRYFSDSYRVSIDIEKYKEVPVLIAMVDNARYSTLLTKEGKILTKAVYAIRNNVKQFLKVNLPEGAKLWSCLVDDRPVRAGEDKEGRIVIPLQKSGEDSGDLEQFSIEIVYLQDRKRLGFAGRAKFLLPGIDLPQVNLAWDIYLPKGYVFWHYAGNVERIRTGKLPFEIVRNQSRQRVYRSQGRAYKGLSDQFSPGTSSESFEVKLQEYRTVGAFPIKIKISPKSRALHFEKLLVAEEPVSAVFAYARGGLGCSLAFIGCIFLGGIGWTQQDKIKGFLKRTSGV